MTITASQGQPSDNPGHDYVGVSIPNRVGYRFMDLDPGANLYVQRDDVLIIQGISDAAGTTVNIGLRELIPGRDTGRTQPDAATIDNALGDSPFGQIIPITATLALPVAYNPGTAVIQLSEGYLLSVAVSATGTPARGATFVKVYIARAGTAVANATYALCADYIANQSPTGWPYGRLVSPPEGPGRLRTVNVANPAAGADWSVTVQANCRWRIASLLATFTASATVANRVPIIRLRDVTNAVDLGRFVAPTAITAGLAFFMTAAPGIVNQITSGNDIAIPLPQPIIMSGQLPVNGLFVSTAGIQVGDQWSSINLTIEEWFDI
jgi:hypothetical protein